MLRAGGEPMLRAIALHEVAGSDARLREALRAADFPTDDVEDEGRAFLEAVFSDGQTIGYAGLERCAGDYLLRSVVVLPEHRGHGFGRAIVEAALRGVGGDSPEMDFIFTVCDSAAGEACPVWIGHPMTAHWGVEDPAAVVGTEVEVQRAFARAARFLKNRISAFINLPIASIDRLALAQHVRQIGSLEGASVKSAKAE